MNSPSYEQAKQLAGVYLKRHPLPTSEQVQEAIQRVVPLVEEPDGVDVGLLCREIESLMNIWVPDATSLQDSRGHVPWLSDNRASIDWHFWRRYATFLEQDQGLPTPVVDSLDRLTDSVLEKLENPKRIGPWDRRGMVVGQVQSGKTANYTGLICKAVDAGYKLIIVLAGVHNSLRSQTQLRLDEGFLGFDTQLSRAFTQRNRQMGAGRIPSEKRLIAHSLTSSADNGDFTSNIASQIGVQLGGDPVLLVVKKNGSVLNNLLKYVQSVATADADGGNSLSDLPLLLLDDEADHASVNTKEVIKDPDTGLVVEDQDPTKINGLIRQLLATFEQVAYVGYTATPFANIFIYPHDDKDELGKYGEDLFPRSFILNLRPPSNYIGPVRVFGLEETPNTQGDADPGLPIVRVVDDAMMLASAIGKSTREYQTLMRLTPEQLAEALPMSLKEALNAFILSCAARTARGQGGAHNSMLIHVTRLTAIQEKVHGAVAQHLTSLKRRLIYGDGDRTPRLRDELRAMWDRDYVPTTEAVSERFDDPLITSISWDEVDASLAEAVSKIETRQINGVEKDILDYYDRKKGLSVIAIGGDKLSRGLTLEGLSVSYYLRTTKMYDTLMQMGRWFGYRPGYADLCRLYTSRELVSWYRHITAASEELRQEFDRMVRLGKTPKEYGLRVQTHPGGLLVTAAGKMREGTKMKVSFELALAETSVFSKDLVAKDKNFAAASAFFHGLGPETQRAGGDFYWQGVPGTQILGFLYEQSGHPLSRAAPEKLRDYIQKKLAYAELTEWTVILVSNQRGDNGFTQFGDGLTVGLTLRSQDKATGDVDSYTPTRRHILSEGDEAKDLSPAKQEEALRETKKAWKDAPGTKTEPTKASGTCLRMMRPKERGLMLVYLLDPHPALGDDYAGTPFVGYALSFPKTDVPTEAAEYIVNRTYRVLEGEDD